MKAVLLALVLAADAGADAPVRAVSVRHAMIEADDGRTLFVDGGVWLAEDVARARVANEWRLDAENRALKAAPAPVPTGYLVAILAGLGAGLVGGAFAAREACKRFPELCG